MSLIKENNTLKVILFILPYLYILNKISNGNPIPGHLIHLIRILRTYVLSW